MTKEEIKQAAENNLDVSMYTLQDAEMLKEAFYIGAKWADRTYTEGDIEKESELYAQGVVGELSEDVRHLLETAYIAGAKRIMK